MDRFGWTHEKRPGDDDVIAVGVQDTYVDSGIGIAQVSWTTSDDSGRRQIGLVQVELAPGLLLSRLLHRTLYVRRCDILDAGTRFDLSE